jgi:hypothetical protein
MLLIQTIITKKSTEQIVLEYVNELYKSSLSLPEDLKILTFLCDLAASSVFPDAHERLKKLIKSTISSTQDEDIIRLCCILQRKKYTEYIPQLHKLSSTNKLENSTKLELKVY